MSLLLDLSRWRKISLLMVSSHVARYTVLSKMSLTGSTMFLLNRLRSNDSNELLNGALDLGIFYENVGGFGDNLTTFPFGSYTLTLVASPEIKKKYPDFITPNQNISLSLIINEQTCVFRQIFEQYLQRKSIVLDHTIELWSIPTIKNLVKNSVGISYLPAFSVENEPNNGELAEIETELSAARISAVCGYNSNKWVKSGHGAIYSANTG